MSVPPLGLDEWFPPLDLHEFRRNVLGRDLLSIPPRPKLADRLLERLAIHSVDDLLKLRGAKVYAWFHQLDGRHTAAVIPASSGRRFYDAGTTLYFRNIVEFAACQHEVASAFGVPRSSVECTLFCNRPHAVTRAHFDTADIITIQLKGRKTWRIAPNEFAPMPLRSYATLGPMAPELRAYAPGVPPTEMPEGATSYVLEKGALLHMPRGYWHETTSDQDSLSLHIQIASPSRADIALALLKNELARDEWWREPSYDLQPDDPHASERAAAICRSLRDAAARLDARDLAQMPTRTGAAETAPRFTRCGQASLGINALDTEKRTARIEIARYQYHRSTITHVELSLEFVAACRWINGLTTGTAFGIPELLQAAPGLDATDAKELLGLLEGASLVRRHEG